VAQTRGQQLLQLRQGADRCLGDPGDPADGGGAQGDHDGGSFLVIEQERRQRTARAKPVAARHASSAVHGIAQDAQPLDVAAQRAVRHLEAPGEFNSRSLWSRRQQRQQLDQPGGGFCHACDSANNSGLILSGIHPTVAAWKSTGITNWPNSSTFTGGPRYALDWTA
jgi:hypothetical protein